MLFFFFPFFSFFSSIISSSLEKEELIKKGLVNNVATFNFLKFS